VDISHSNPGVVVHNILTTDAALSFADVGGGTNGFPWKSLPAGLYACRNSGRSGIFATGVTLIER
jgi:hypothetical protein